MEIKEIMDIMDIREMSEIREIRDMIMIPPPPPEKKGMNNQKTVTMTSPFDYWMITHSNWWVINSRLNMRYGEKNSLTFKYLFWITHEQIAQTQKIFLEKCHFIKWQSKILYNWLKLALQILGISIKFDLESYVMHY